MSLSSAGAKDSERPTSDHRLYDQACGTPNNVPRLVHPSNGLAPRLRSNPPVFNTAYIRFDDGQAANGRWLEGLARRSIVGDLHPSARRLTRYTSTADGQIRPLNDSREKDARKPRTTMSRRSVQRLRPERNEIIIAVKRWSGRPLPAAWQCAMLAVSSTPREERGIHGTG